MADAVKVGIVRENRNGRTLYRLKWRNDAERSQGIRLSGRSEENVREIADVIGIILGAARAGKLLDITTKRWLANADDDLKTKLGRAGLIAAPLPKTPPAGSQLDADSGPDGERLGHYLDRYIESRTELGEHRVRNLKDSRRKLVDYFGAEKPLRVITRGNADAWRQSLVNARKVNDPEARRFSKATISKAVKDARQFFDDAKRQRLVKRNPFDHLRAGGEVNKAREHFVEAAVIDQVLEAARTVEWKVVIALSRYGGLRVPSEALRLTWSDVDWANNRLTVTCTKTAGQGKPFRVVPLFPELRGYLECAFDVAPDGARFVVAQYRDASNANLRTEMLRTIRRAAVDPWPRLFHNMRASRQTELEQHYPLQDVCKWLGNSPKTAERHYLQTRDVHFQRAIAGFHVPSKGGWTQSGPEKLADETPPDADYCKATVGDAVNSPHFTHLQTSGRRLQSELAERYPRQESNL